MDNKICSYSNGQQNISSYSNTDIQVNSKFDNGIFFRVRHSPKNVQADSNEEIERPCFSPIYGHVPTVFGNVKCILRNISF